jgi:DNA-3-methyladenine glycosylase
MKLKPLNRSFFARSTPQVAGDLLGKYVVRILDKSTLVGKIVETESYTSEEPACHAFRGKTARTCALFEEVGRAYIYFIYGNYFCLNVVARESGVKAGGVLIRALEPIQGIEIMQKLRPHARGYDITNGPGKLAQAFAIDRSLYSCDVTHKGPLYIAQAVPQNESFVIKEAIRIGISKATDLLHRFYIVGSPWISKK